MLQPSTARQFVTMNNDQPAATSKRCPDNDNINSNVTVALVGLGQDDADLELIEEQNEARL